MTKYVRETAAAKSLSAWIILKGSRHVATVQAHYGSSRVLVNIWQSGHELQTGTASGYGYDKLTAALAGLTVDGHQLTDHCARLDAPKPPKGNAGLYPSDYKPRKGFSLANYCRASRATGRILRAYDWQERARESLGIGKDSDPASWAQVNEKAIALEQEWRESDDCVTGYSDCYREPGLRYLEKIGYSVHSAI